jgi:hypothetical protein
MRTARFVGPAFSRPAYHRRTHHGEEEEEKERKEVIDPIGSFPLRQRRGTRWRTAISKAEKGPVLAPALFLLRIFPLVVPALDMGIHVFG